MKYFEINEPYYALIQADSVEKAIEEYTNTVADNIDNEVEENIVEINTLDAVIAYGSGVCESGDVLTVKELIEDISDLSTKTLLIDGSLL